MYFVRQTEFVNVLLGGDRKKRDLGGYIHNIPTHPPINFILPINFMFEGAMPKKKSPSLFKGGRGINLGNILGGGVVLTSFRDRSWSC